MKLYTEEQVREALNAGFRLAIETGCGLNDYRELFINALTPIELPSDEEIENESPYVPKDSHIICFAHQDGFIDGAIWLREKIKGGEND